MSNTPDVRAPSPVAVFDFDGTLTDRDSLFPFLRMAVGGLKFYWGLLVLSPILIGYALGLVPNWQAKQTVLTYFLADLTAEKLHQLGQRFALEELPKLLRPEALQRLKWHQQQGHQTVIVSASLEAYLLPWAQTMSFDQVIGTQLEVQNGRLTGRIWGRNCYGLEKVERLKALLGNLDRYCLYAYGDSRGDREILDASHYPYYRSFEDPRAAESQGLTLHWERGLIWSVVAAAVIYAGVVLWSGADQFLAALNRLPAWLIPASLALVFVGYCFRFLRWQWYLYYMSYQVPLVSSFRIFFASFALSASPGRAGESIKSLLLKRRHNVPIAPTLAGLFCERFTDLLSVLFLISFGLFSAIQGQWAIATVGLAQLIIVLILQRPNLLKKRIIKPLGRWSRLRAIIRKIEALIDSISTLLDPKILVGSVLLGSLSWVFEGIALYWLFQCLGAEAISLYQAVMILAASDLIGAISFLPGGIGGAEATIISLSIFYGASQTEAITATFLIRFLTLWFGVWLGILAMLSEQKA